MNKTKKGSLVAERTLKALMLFSKTKYISVTDIANSLEISLTAAYRLVDSLHGTGFIKTAHSKEYTLDSPNILQLYNMVEYDLRKVARPIIKEIASEFHESVYLSVVHNDKYFSFIEKEDSPSQLKWTENIGNVHPLPSGTAGKTHLAYIIKDLNDSEKDEFISQLELKPYTEKSLVVIKDLKYSLKKILNDGYCYTNSEHLNGVIGISVPVYNFKKTTVVAVLSIFMAESRYDENELMNYVISLKNGAEKMSKYIS
ncbi:IclR family transcriptional regulator [Bacillus sp. FJAT-29937]|uniref:IclR family transcriptional regulator n=1 Tax=Bacillus sp. FJAT-29937 TaxID=1720553 RepID=UPI00082CDAC6|nr:IclR family transcriptional regulator C-terminal domain-containing protein [Bacillus sp. FJAT-29937]